MTSEDPRKLEEVKPIGQHQVLPSSIKQRHLEGLMIFTGTAANKPDGTTEVRAYFETDTGVLSIWSGSAWLSTTLS